MAIRCDSWMLETVWTYPVYSPDEAHHQGSPGGNSHNKYPQRRIGEKVNGLILILQLAHLFVYKIRDFFFTTLSSLRPFCLSFTYKGNILVLSEQR